MNVNPHRVGLVLGSLLAVLHIAWAFFVAVGWAQPLVNFVTRLHFFESPSTVAPFVLGEAAMLVILAGMFGYLIGFVFGTLWNTIHR